MPPVCVSVCPDVRRSGRRRTRRIDNETIVTLLCNSLFLTAGVCPSVAELPSQGFASCSTRNSSFRRRSSQPISWLSADETKPKETKANKTRTKWQKLRKKVHLNAEPKSAVNFKNCLDVCTYHCALVVVHSTAQNSSDNFFPSDNHPCSCVIYWRNGEWPFFTVLHCVHGPSTWVSNTGVIRAFVFEGRVHGRSSTLPVNTTRWHGRVQNDTRVHVP